MGPLPQKNRFDESTLDTPKLISEVKFREIVQQEQEIRESVILEKYVESGWRQYGAGLRVSDEEKKYYYRQFLLGRGELLLNPMPFTELSFEEARREYIADIEEASQVAFLFLEAALNGYETEERQCEIRNLCGLYPCASQCGGNVGYEVIVNNKDELLREVTKFIEKHRKKGRIVILFVGHDEPDGQITLAGENCPLQEYIDNVDEVASKLYPPVPIDLINDQCYAHLVPRAQSPSVNIIHLSNIDNPETHSFGNNNISGNVHLDCYNVELKTNGQTKRNKQDTDAGIESISLARGFAMTLFPDNIDERFKCKTCKLVLRDPMQAPCGHRHCKTCLDDFIRSSGGRLCPACPEEAEGGESQIFPDSGMRREVHKLKTICDQDGCGWTGCLRDYQEKHEKSCRSRQFTTPDAETRAQSYRGAEWNEQRIFMKYDLRLPDLKKLIHACDCGLPGCLRDYQENLEKSFPPRQSTTPDAEPRGRSDRGAKWNQQTIFTGPSLRAKDLQNLSPVHECLTQLTGTFKGTTISTSEDVYNNSGVLIWKITDFFSKLQDSKSSCFICLDSPPFYTSRGYKMCCRVFLNGFKTGRGTHISVYFLIMPGQFDDQLTWPFDQSMSITLVDQKDTDPSDITNNFIPDPTSGSSWRPSDMQIVAGDPQYVPHRVLYHNTETAYVKDDVMILRATVA